MKMHQCCTKLFKVITLLQLKGFELYLGRMADKARITVVYAKGCGFSRLCFITLILILAGEK